METNNHTGQYISFFISFFFVFFIAVFPSWADISQVRMALHPQTENSNSLIRTIEIEGSDLFQYGDTETSTAVNPIVLLGNATLEVFSVSEEEGIQKVIAIIPESNIRGLTEKILFLIVSNEQGQYKSPVFFNKWLLTQVNQSEGTSLGNMTGNGGLQAAFDSVEFVNSENRDHGASLADSIVPGYIGKDWGVDTDGNDIKKIIKSVNPFPMDDLYYSNAPSFRIKLFGSNAANSWPDGGDELGVILNSNVPSGDNLTLPLIPYRYHWVKLIPASPDGAEDTTNNYSKHFAEVKFAELRTPDEGVVFAEVSQQMALTDNSVTSSKIENGTIQLEDLDPSLPTQGLKGDKGDQGERGENGMQGILGEQGLVGDAGPIGLTGGMGEPGSQGIQGEIGETGPAGTIPAFRGALVRLQETQSVPRESWHEVSWNVEEEDTSAFHSSSSPTRFTIPPEVTRVRLSASVRWIGEADDVGARFTFIKMNGNINISGIPSASSSVLNQISDVFDAYQTIQSISSYPIAVSQGDYFEVVLWHNSQDHQNVQISAPDTPDDPENQHEHTWFGIEVVE